jgi:membrane fusion protein (multidrug efflux system)
MTKRNYFLITTGGLLAAVLLTGCGGGGSGEAPEPPPVQVQIESVTTGLVEDILSAVGTIQANEEVEIRAETPGTISAIYFQEGQHVRAKDKLFELDSEKEAAQLAQAVAEEEVARQNLERAKKLAGTKAISQQELDQLQSLVAARTAARQLQEARLGDMTIRAPFAGVVGPRTVSVGQYVDVTQVLVTLVDDSRVKVTYRIPERDLAQYDPGQNVRITVSAYPGRVFQGTIDLINPVVDQATRTAQIRALADNPDGLLKPGMFARAETVVARRENSIVIPETALVPGLDQFSVYRVNQEKAHLVPVEMGVRGRGTVEIRQGLAVGDEIVVLGTQKLVDGSRVSGTSEPAVAKATVSSDIASELPDADREPSTTN